MTGIQLSEITYDAQPPVDSYGPGFFRIGGHVHQGSVFISAAGVAEWQGDWEKLSGEGYDVLLIGTGADIVSPSDDIRATLQTTGIAFEVMATAPAARTYNILLSEGRRIACILVAV